MLKKLQPTIFILAALFSLAGCKDDDSPTPDPGTGADPINSWVYNTMREVYYWTDEIPTNVDLTQTPENLFNSLLSKEDRFSVIVANYDELIASLSGVTKDAGYEFALVGVTDTDQVVAAVTYVKDGSSAQAAGIKRGDIIHQINGTVITQDNYRTLIPGIYENHSITYRRYNFGASQYEEQGSINLSAVVLAENPHLLDTVYNIGDKKIGYYVYNFFSPGPDKSTEYDEQMDNIIGKFKSEGINELILDLRYNSGGAVSSATNLGSLLAKGVTTTDIFYQNQWNDLYQNYIEGLADGDDILRGKFKSKAQNIGTEIGGNLYVLTGSRTASASELIINGLDPYMNVTIIGETTVGKNVGSIPLEDDNNPNNEYGMLPIVFKIFNSEMYSGYSNGFTPQGDNLVDDLQFPLRALGHVEEPLLERALALISGSSTGGRQARVAEVVKEPIGSSLDYKQRSNRLIFDTPIK